MALTNLPMCCKTYKDSTYGIATVVAYHGEPWILTKDICTELKYQNIYALLNKYVSAENKIHLQIPELKKKAGAGRPPTLFVNQKGLEEIVRHANQNPKAMAIYNWMLQNKKPAESKPAPIRERQLVELDERYGKALHDIYKSQCMLHQENLELRKELGDIKASLHDLLSSMRINGTNWKDAAKIIAKSGPRGEIQNRFHELYHLLEQASHVNLKVRRENLQKKYPTRKISTLDAIGEDGKLVALFIVILRNYALTHGVNVKIDKNWKGAA